MQPERGPERGRRLADGAERVRHQRAAARPGFGEQHGVGPAHVLPDDRAPEAEDLAERLGDFRGGREIRERVACRVVEGVGAGHEPVEPLGHRRARQTMNAPISTIGTDSSWPMVAPSNRNPRNGSGSRKNSPMIRKMP